MGAPRSASMATEKQYKRDAGRKPSTRSITPSSSERRSLVHLPAWFGIEAARRVSQPRGRGLELLQVVFGQHHVEIFNLLLHPFPGGQCAVVVGAVALPC